MLTLKSIYQDCLHLYPDILIHVLDLKTYCLRRKLVENVGGTHCPSLRLRGFSYVQS